MNGEQSFVLGVHASQPLSADYFASSAGHVDTSNKCWPWLLCRGDVDDASVRAPLTSLRLALEEADGPWQSEAVYRVARLFTDTQGNARHLSMYKADLIEQLEELFAFPAFDISTRVVLSRRHELSGGDCLRLHELLSADHASAIERPWPRPDQEFQGTYVDDWYSEGTLLSLTAQVYGAACSIYERLASTVFSTFGWSLALGASGHFVVVGELRKTNGQQGVDYSVAPSFESAAGEHPAIEEWTSEPSGRAFIRRRDGDERDVRWWARTEHPEVAALRQQLPFVGFYSGSSVLKVFSDRPASAIAADWLWRDLTHLGLVGGAGPSLSSSNNF